ncbi:hypothetical protein BDY24DRAFT_412537 [Mrakia frigida]|uniref:uncharacterized protein n=1 Tax=Mrakia frigida TaxID=29902 RepID=UPI003FCC0BC7
MPSTLFELQMRSPPSREISSSLTRPSTPKPSTDGSVLPAGAVAYPRTQEDVSTLIKWAGEEKVEFAVCRGGHSSGGSE